MDSFPTGCSLAFLGSHEAEAGVRAYRRPFCEGGSQLCEEVSKNYNKAYKGLRLRLNLM